MKIRFINTNSYKQIYVNNFTRLWLERPLCRCAERENLSEYSEAVIDISHEIDPFNTVEAHIIGIVF
jgi:hypothetical protein